ncbi:MAG: AI-2E family transporter [Candidatus Kapabacteria bacterium]|nr:AI-2E family transporter [Candidatus Kapabacteria bacterium]
MKVVISKMQDNTIKNILILFLAIVIFYILNELASIILPLVLALLGAIVMQPFIDFLLKRKIPKLFILPTVSIISLAVLFGIFLIVSDTVSSIVEQQEYLLSRLLSKLDGLLTWTNHVFHLKLDTTLLVSEIYKRAGDGWLSGFMGDLASGLGSFLGSFLFFALYYIMLLAGMSGYKDYMSYVGADKSEQFLAEYAKIQHSIFSYVAIKTLISIVTGLLVYGICLSFGIKFAFFWGFSAFLLNFIPNIGSILGTIFPILMAIIQYDSFQTIFLISILLVSVQFLMGNLIEPIVMGNRLRLNTLTVLFGLVFWGYIWGIPGMLLSVPLMVILKIILERFPAFSFIARIMGYPEKT